MGLPYITAAQAEVIARKVASEGGSTPEPTPSETKLYRHSLVVAINFRSEYHAINFKYDYISSDSEQITLATSNIINIFNSMRGLISDRKIQYSDETTFYLLYGGTTAGTQTPHLSVLSLSDGEISHYNESSGLSVADTVTEL